MGVVCASEKYPLDGSCEQYILEHGGQMAGRTTFVDTNYHFDVNNDSFEEAMDRCISSSCVCIVFYRTRVIRRCHHREIEAVDSEHQSYLLVDGRRMLQIKIHMTCPRELEDVVQKLEEGTSFVVGNKIGRTVIIYRPSLTRMNVQEQKRRARRVFVKKEFKTKPSLPGQQTKFYGHGHGYCHQGSRRAEV